MTYKQKETNVKETEAVCVLTMIMMNILLLIVVTQTIWLVYTLFNNKNFLEVVINGSFLP